MGNAIKMVRKTTKLLSCLPKRRCYHGWKLAHFIFTPKWRIIPQPALKNYISQVLSLVNKCKNIVRKHKELSKKQMSFFGH